jgi:hypothetical protein
MPPGAPPLAYSFCIIGLARASNSVCLSLISSMEADSEDSSRNLRTSSSFSWTGALSESLSLSAVSGADKVLQITGARRDQLLGAQTSSKVCVLTVSTSMNMTQVHSWQQYAP